MSENAVADVTKKVEKTVTTPVTWAKQNPWAFAFLVVVAGIVFLRFSSKLQGWIGAKAATGSKVWAKIAKLCGVAVGAVVFLVAARALASDHSAANLAEQLPLMVAGAFPMCGTVHMKDETGNYTSAVTPGTAIMERRFNFEAPRETFQGFPIMVDAVEFALKFRLTQPASTASAVMWDELHRLCAGLDVRSPRFDVMDRKEDLTGPVLKHIQEFITNGYSYSGDEIMTEIASTAGNYTCTCYFARNYTQRWAAKPEEFAIFSGWLQKTQYSFWLNKATALGDGGVSTGATIAGLDATLRASYRYFTRAVQGDRRQAYGVPPLVNHRVFRTPANGQIDIPFTGIGVSGPANTVTPAGERVFAMALLSDYLGLPGPGDVNDITEIGCEAIGLMNTQNVDMHLKAMLPELCHGGHEYSLAEATLSNSRGWPWTLGHLPTTTGNILDKADLLLMPLILPAKRGQKITKLFRLKGDITVHARRDTPPSGGTTSHALYVGGLRDIDPNYAAEMLGAVGITGTTTRAAQGSGAALVGIPQVAQG